MQPLLCVRKTSNLIFHQSPLGNIQLYPVLFAFLWKTKPPNSNRLLKVRRFPVGHVLSFESESPVVFYASHPIKIIPSKASRADAKPTLYPQPAHPFLLLVAPLWHSLMIVPIDFNWALYLRASGACPIYHPPPPWVAFWFSLALPATLRASMPLLLWSPGLA